MIGCPRIIYSRVLDMLHLPLISRAQPSPLSRARTTATHPLPRSLTSVSPTDPTRPIVLACCCLPRLALRLSLSHVSSGKSDDQLMARESDNVMTWHGGPGESGEFHADNPSFYRLMEASLPVGDRRKGGGRKDL